MAEPPWLKEAMEKYKLKLDHVRLRSIYASIIPKIDLKTAEAQAQNHWVISQVQPILDRYGVLPELRASYYHYAFHLDRSQRKYEYMVDLKREHQILRTVWEAKGLNPDILDEIDKKLIFRR